LSDLDCGSSGPLDDAAQFLMAPVRVLGASDPWAGILDDAMSVAARDPLGAKLLLVKEGLSAAAKTIDHISSLPTINGPSDSTACYALRAAKGLVLAFGDLHGLDEALLELRASIRKAEPLFKGRAEKSSAQLAMSMLYHVSPEIARSECERNKPTQAEIDAAKAEQREFAKMQACEATRSDAPCVSDSRRMKAEFGRSMADLVEGLALANNGPKLGDSESKKLAQAFRRYAELSDGSKASRDPKTGRNEKEYQKASSFLASVAKGKTEISDMCQFILEEFLPWAMLNKGDQYDPGVRVLPTMAKVGKAISAEWKRLAKAAAPKQ
jgi:hypothetical protein